MKVLIKIIWTLIFTLSMSFLFLINAQVVDDFVLDNLDNEQVSLDELKGENLTVIGLLGNMVQTMHQGNAKT